MKHFEKKGWIKLKEKINPADIETIRQILQRNYPGREIQLIEGRDGNDFITSEMTFLINVENP